MAPQQLSTQSTSGLPYTSYHSTSSIGGGGTTNMHHQDSGQVLGTLLLSPIKEMDSSSSNNTLIPGHPATAALAQAVMPTRLKDAFAANCKYISNCSVVHPISLTNPSALQPYLRRVTLPRSRSPSRWPPASRAEKQCPRAH